MAVTAVGPAFTNGFEVVTTGEGDDQYVIWYLPDLQNRALQDSGQPAVYYAMPSRIRVARKGDAGDYKFRLIHFVGRGRSEEYTAGGALSLTTTAAPPPAVLENAHQQILERFRGSDNYYWGWRSAAAPRISPMPLAASSVSMSNLSPKVDGTVPVPDTDTVGGVPRASQDGETTSLLAPMRQPREVPFEPRAFQNAFRDETNLDIWYSQLQGVGAGSIDPTGENAFTALLGNYPTAILWNGFHGAYSPVSVTYALQLKVWSPVLDITITGDWEKIWSNFDLNAKGRAYWLYGEIRYRVTEMISKGLIEVDIKLDDTVPPAASQKEEVERRIDQVVQAFTQQAQEAIFNAATPTATAAQAKEPETGLFRPWGAAFSLVSESDIRKLELDYHETRSLRYNHGHVISSTLEGFYDEIKADSDAENKYFSRIYLDDWDTRVSRIVAPVAAWSQDGTGDPIDYMFTEIGYPTTEGDLRWQPHRFAENEQTPWTHQYDQKRASDVRNPPEGWEPDKAFIRRTVGLSEPGSPTPYRHIDIERNTIELDPVEHGTLTDRTTLEVRADSAGRFDLWMSLGVLLVSPAETVEVEIQALGKTLDGNERPVHKFIWHLQDQEQSRRYTIFTGDPAFVPSFKYRVHVIIKGTLSSAGKEWWGPWREGAGLGEYTVPIPTEDQAVDTRELTTEEILTTEGGGADGKVLGPPRSDIRSFLPRPPKTPTAFEGDEETRGAIEIGPMWADEEVQMPIEAEPSEADEETVQGYRLRQSKLDPPTC